MPSDSNRRQQHTNAQSCQSFTNGKTNLIAGKQSKSGAVGELLAPAVGQQWWCDTWMMMWHYIWANCWPQQLANCWGQQPTANSQQPEKKPLKTLPQDLQEPSPFEWAAVAAGGGGWGEGGGFRSSLSCLVERLEPTSSPLNVPILGALCPVSLFLRLGGGVRTLVFLPFPLLGHYCQGRQHCSKTRKKSQNSESVFHSMVSY